MNEFKFGTYCKKCFLRKYKLSKKNVDRIIYTPYIETCECCGKIEKLVDTYTKFLVMGDERLLLLNRMAPMIPFAGAFIAIAKWDLKKSIFYIVLGCVLKYGIIMLLSNMFLDFFSSDQAQLFMIIMIVVVIAVSMVLSIVVKKRHGIDKEQNTDGKE